MVHVGTFKAQVLMREFVNFKVNQNVALQQAVVEDQVNVEIVFVKCESLLPCFKQEALAQLQQEGLHLADGCILQIGLRAILSYRLLAT